MKKLRGVKTKLLLKIQNTIKDLGVKVKD